MAGVRTNVGTGNSVYFILTVMFVVAVGVFGLGVMFVRATNIERTLLVGGLTVLTAVVSIVMLAYLPAASQTGPILTSIAAVSLVGYVVGRAIDFVLGAREHTDPSDGEATLGADLAD